jgi:hypothetical protein
MKAASRRIVLMALSMVLSLPSIAAVCSLRLTRAILVSLKVTLNGPGGNSPREGHHRTGGKR